MTLAPKYIVVSLPATTRVKQKRTTSSVESRPPSSSSAVSKASSSVPSGAPPAASARVRAATAAAKYAIISTFDRMRSSGAIGADSTKAFAQCFSRSASAGGKPRRCNMTRGGISEAMAATASISPAGRPSRIAPIIASTQGPSSRTRFGVKARLTSRRSRACSGGSWFTSISVGAEVPCWKSADENVR
jgi:hypothetical protein